MTKGDIMANENKMEFVILGLLSHEALTGYEIKKKMDHTMSLFWSGSYGSIYPTLQKLMKSENITCEEMIQAGREKKQYSITDYGRERLSIWLSDLDVKNELKYETLLKFFFGSESSEKVMLEHVDTLKMDMLQLLPKLNHSVQSLKNDPSEPAHEYYMLTALFGVKIYEASIAWCEEVEKYFEMKEKQ